MSALCQQEGAKRCVFARDCTAAQAQSVIAACADGTGDLAQPMSEAAKYISTPADLTFRSRAQKYAVAHNLMGAGSMYGPPGVCKGDYGARVDSLRQCIRPHSRKLLVPGPRWKSARPDPHKSCVFYKTLNLPGFRNAGRLSGHLSSFLPADVVSCTLRYLGRCRVAAQTAAAFSASNGRPLVSTAQAMRASLLASATSATL